MGCILFKSTSERALMRPISAPLVDDDGGCATPPPPRVGAEGVGVEACDEEDDDSRLGVDADLPNGRIELDLEALSPIAFVLASALTVGESMEHGSSPSADDDDDVESFVGSFPL